MVFRPSSLALRVGVGIIEEYPGLRFIASRYGLERPNQSPCQASAASSWSITSNILHAIPVDEAIRSLRPRVSFRPERSR